MYIQKLEGPYTNKDATHEERSFHESFKNTAFYNTPEFKQQERVSSHKIQFRTGKSIVFQMGKNELAQYTQTLPLYIFLFILTAAPPSLDFEEPITWKPVLIGSVSIPMGDMNIVDPVDTPQTRKEFVKKRTISGNFTLKNDRGYDVGVVDMDIRLRSMPKEVVPNVNDFLTSKFADAALHRPMTIGREKSVTIQTGAVTRNPLFTVTDKTLQGSTRGVIAGRGEFGALTTLVDQYKETQQQTIMMKGQIENQIATMTAQLSEISKRLTGNEIVETKKKTKKKSKVLNSAPIKRPSSASATARKTTPSRSSTRTKESEGRKETGLRGTSQVGVRPPSSGIGSLSSSRKRSTKQDTNNSLSFKLSTNNEHIISQAKNDIMLDEEFARQTMFADNFQDNEREATALKGLIPQLAETLKLLKKKKKDDDQAEDEVITIPVELYKTIKNNNDRYNNIQRSYQLIMEEFMDHPQKLFSSMAQVDTRGMTLREKELWKNQNKLITLLKDNYETIKQEKDLQSLKTAPRNLTRVDVEELEATSSSSDEEEKKRKKEKRERKAREKKEKKSKQPKEKQRESTNLENQEMHLDTFVTEQNALVPNEDVKLSSAEISTGFNNQEVSGETFKSLQVTSDPEQSRQENDSSVPSQEDAQEILQVQQLNPYNPYNPYQPQVSIQQQQSQPPYQTQQTQSEPQRSLYNPYQPSVQSYQHQQPYQPQQTQPEPVQSFYNPYQPNTQPKQDQQDEPEQVVYQPSLQQSQTYNPYQPYQEVQQASADVRGSVQVSETNYSSFGDFEGEFHNGEEPQFNETIQSESFEVVEVPPMSHNTPTEAIEEEYEDFEQDFETMHTDHNDVVEEVVEDEESFDDMHHRSHGPEEEIVHSIDYSGIEERTEEERI